MVVFKDYNEFGVRLDKDIKILRKLLLEQDLETIRRAIHQLTMYYFKELLGLFPTELKTIQVKIEYKINMLRSLSHNVALFRSLEPFMYGGMVAFNKIHKIDSIQATSKNVKDGLFKFNDILNLYNLLKISIISLSNWEACLKSMFELQELRKSLETWDINEIKQYNQTKEQIKQIFNDLEENFRNLSKEMVEPLKLEGEFY